MSEPKPSYLDEPIIGLPFSCSACGVALGYQCEYDGVPYLRIKEQHVYAEIVGHAALRCSWCGRATVWNGETCQDNPY